MHLANGQISRESPQSSDDLLEIYRLSNRAEDFERIVRRYAALVLCECRRVTGNVYDAEDASQMVFLALAMEIKSGAVINKLGAWLKQVSRRQSLKIVRTRTRRRRREDAARRSEVQVVDADSSIDSTVIAGIIRDEIDQLPERYRLAVILYYFGGMTLELIAQELRITRPAVGTRLHRGRKLLGERLSRQGVRLDEATLTAALGVLVPATVVGAVLRAASGPPAPIALAMPAAMRQVLQTIAVSTLQRPLRLAAVSAILAAGTSGLALVSDYKLPSIHQVMEVNPIEWIRKVLQKGSSFKIQISAGGKAGEKSAPAVVEAKAAPSVVQHREGEVAWLDQGWKFHFGLSDGVGSANNAAAIGSGPIHLSAVVNHTGGMVQAVHEDVVGNVVIHRENVAARGGSAKPQAAEVAGMMAPGGSGGSRRGVAVDVAVKETPKISAPVTTIEGSRGDEVATVRVASVGSGVVANYDELSSNHAASISGSGVSYTSSVNGISSSLNVEFSSDASGGHPVLVFNGLNPSAGGGGSVAIPSAIPEPGSIPLLVGGSLLVGRRKRRGRSS